MKRKIMSIILIMWAPYAYGQTGGTPYSGQLCVFISTSLQNNNYYLGIWKLNWTLYVYLSK